MHHVTRFRSHGGYRSALIKTPDWISERPLQVGLSFLYRLFCECLLMAAGQSLCRNILSANDKSEHRASKSSARAKIC
jgi:hypothetical protein